MNDNERLMRENERLEKLSRMLLQAPAFHAFMDELTNPNNPNNSKAQEQPQQQPARVSKPEQQTSVPPAATNDWALSYNNWNPTPQVFRVQLPEPPALEDLFELEDDCAISDGFFANMRNEKADFTMAYNPEEPPTYTPPENLSDVVMRLEDEKPRKEPEQRTSYKGENLDTLFPGVGVNNLLERIEKVASGEPVEQHFKECAGNIPSTTQNPSQEQRQQQAENADSRFKEAAGVYRRIGLMVQ